MCNGNCEHCRCATEDKIKRFEELLNEIGKDIPSYDFEVIRMELEKLTREIRVTK